MISWSILFLIFSPIQGKLILDIKIFFFSDSPDQYFNICPTRDCVATLDVCFSSENETCDILRSLQHLLNGTLREQQIIKTLLYLPRMPETFHIKSLLFVYGKKNYSNSFTSTLCPTLHDTKIGYLKSEKFVKDYSIQYHYWFHCDQLSYGDNCQNLCKANSRETQCLMAKCNSSCINGKCQLDRDKMSASCVCTDWWQGKYCTNRISLCDNNFCSDTELVCQNRKCTCGKDGHSYCRQFYAKISEKPKGSTRKDMQFFIASASLLILAVFGFIGFVIVSLRKRLRIPRIEKFVTYLSEEELEELNKSNNHFIKATMIQDDATSLDVIQEELISEDMSHCDAISTEMVQDDNISTEFIQDDNISTEFIQDDNISTEFIQDDNISTEFIQDDNISTEFIQDDNISTEFIQEDNISTDVVQDDNINTETLQEGEIRK